MLLESIEVNNFRNLTGGVTWGNDLNIIGGENGQGKTNWIEAIYLLATSKSYRTQRLQEVISFDQDFTTINGRVAHSSHIYRDLEVAIQANTKTISLNGKREVITNYLGQLHPILFTGEELKTVREGPELRRRFLDRGIVSHQKSYIQTLADYERILKQKNRLLQSVTERGISIQEARVLVEPWNEQLVHLGEIIHRSRCDYANSLEGILKYSFFDKEVITIRYISFLKEKGDIHNYKEVFAERLNSKFQAEIASGYALLGPHRDDLEILFDGRYIRTYGSSGQQRTALISLDLAAIELYHSWHKEYPIFLLDDVDAELDQHRISSLIEYLKGRTQTFMTTSKEDLLQRFASHAAIYNVSRGSAIKIN